MTAIIKDYGSTSNNGEEVSPLLVGTSGRTREPPSRSATNCTDNGDANTPAVSLSSPRRCRYDVTVSILVGMLFLLFLMGNNRSSSSSSSTPPRTSWLVFWNPLYRQSHPSHRHKLTQTLDHLDEQLTGQVYYRQDHSFATKWPVWNQAITVPPFAVIQVANAQDVAWTVPVLIQLETEYNIPWAIQSGGHNYAGWSSVPNGVVLSLRKLHTFDLLYDDQQQQTNNVENDDNATATTTTMNDDAAGSTVIAAMGPGTSDGDILKMGLLDQGYAGVVGSSSEVCMGGWMLGGGFGYWSRRYGLGIDNVIAMDVVLGDGRMVTATDTNEYADLFWALRGAGQATLGVVTGYQYKLYPAQDEMLQVTGHLPYHLAAHTLTKLGFVERELPRSIFAEVGSDEHGMLLSFICIGETEQILVDCQGVIRKFLSDTLPRDVADGFSYDRTSWYQGALDETAEFEGLLVRDWNGFLLRDDNGFDNWSIIVDAFSEFKDNPYVVVDIELFGGAVNDVDPSATAFPWRNALFSVGVLVAVPSDEKHAGYLYDELVDKVDKVWNDSVQHLLQGVFMNYAMKSREIDPKAYASAAWGNNLGRLMAIKAKYDPQDSFHSALEIQASIH